MLRCIKSVAHSCIVDVKAISQYHPIYLIDFVCLCASVSPPLSVCVPLSLLSPSVCVCLSPLHLYVCLSSLPLCHRLRGKTTMDGAVFDIAQILAYLVHYMSRSQLYLGFGHFGWLPSFFGQKHFGGLMVKLYFLCWNYFLSSGWHIIAA